MGVLRLTGATIPAGIRVATTCAIARVYEFNPHSPDDGLISATVTPIQI
jgi:hypothetical protein